MVLGSYVLIVEPLTILPFAIVFLYQGLDDLLDELSGSIIFTKIDLFPLPPSETTYFDASQ
jgi:hypothetical protein